MGLTYYSKQRFINNPDDKRHGTITGYRYGCMCERCKEAGRVYAKEYREKARERFLADARAAREAEKAPAAHCSTPKKPAKAKRRYMVDVCTIPAFLRPLMGKPDIGRDSRFCAVCGRPATNMHHIVKRSAGKWVKDGKEVRKPCVRLCGDGNVSGCHELAHAGRLYFRWNNERNDWEFRFFSEPTKAQEALQAEGWWAPFEDWG